jgi:hypothetical protein
MHGDGERPRIGRGRLPPRDAVRLREELRVGQVPAGPTYRGVRNTGASNPLSQRASELILLNSGQSDSDIGERKVVDPEDSLDLELEPAWEPIPEAGCPSSYLHHKREIAIAVGKQYGPQSRDVALRSKGADPSTAAEKGLTRGTQLLKRYKWEQNLQTADEDLDPRRFAEWVIVLSEFLSSSSLRVYRQAAEAMIRKLPQEGRDEAIAMLTGTGPMETSARGQYKQTLEKNPKLFRDHAKRMPVDDYRKLRASLRNMSPSTLVLALDDWLVAGLLTGLLPGEWPLAALENRLDDQSRRRVWLHVVNAGAAGVNRTLDISKFTEETLQAIERMIERSEKWALEGSIDRHRSEVARLLAKICDRIFPRRSIQYSLFSLRDQWVANMSAVKTEPAELSALLGRMKVKTDGEHYRNRRGAWETDDINEIPKALECQVARYRRMWAMYEDRRMYHKR